MQNVSDLNISSSWSVTSICLGSLLGLCALPGWLANSLVLVLIIKGRFLCTGHVTYWLMSSLCVGDLITLTVMLFYLAPSAVLQQWLLPKNLHPVPGDIFLVCWYHMWFMLSAIGINRYYAICHFLRYQNIFTRAVTKITVVFSWIFAILIWTHFLWIPCCRFYVSFVVYSFMWDSKSAVQTNWGDLLIEWPGNFGTTAVLIFCYTKVILKVRRTSLRVRKRGSRSSISEKSLALQFFVISLVYTAVWTTFRLCPVLIGSKSMEAYSIVAILVITNSSVNPFVYLYFNDDLRNCLPFIRRRNESYSQKMSNCQASSIGFANNSTLDGDNTINYSVTLYISEHSSWV